MKREVRLLIHTLPQYAMLYAAGYALLSLSPYGHAVGIILPTIYFTLSFLLFEREAKRKKCTWPERYMYFLILPAVGSFIIAGILVNIFD